MKKTIGITYDLKSDWPVALDDPIDASAELDTFLTVENICRALEVRGHKVKKIGNVKNLFKKLDHLGVDIVFNICEGFWGRSRESQVPMILEMAGIPFVGSDGLTMGITLDKVVAKRCFIAEGIPTPRFFVTNRTDRLQELNTIGFPLIVKPAREGSSKGLSDQSRVTDEQSLKRQVDFIHRTYKQPALVEEFIRGTEFTVAVIGNDQPIAMPVVQVSIDGVRNLGDDFYTFSRLLNSDRVQYICPTDIPLELDQKLKDLAVQVYQCVDCRDFGRVDFRVDEQGHPFVLEINPLPCLARNDVFFFTAQASGFTYEEMINRILEFGLERYSLLSSQDGYKPLGSSLHDIKSFADHSGKALL